MALHDVAWLMCPGMKLHRLVLLALQRVGIALHDIVLRLVATLHMCIDAHLHCTTLHYIALCHMPRVSTQTP